MHLSVIEEANRRVNLFKRRNKGVEISLKASTRSFLTFGLKNDLTNLFGFQQCN